MKNLFVAGLALASIAAFDCAQAADMAVKAPPVAPPPAWTWTGFYVGVNVGYSWGRDPTTYNGSDTSTTVLTNLTSGGTPRAGNGTTAVTTASAVGATSGKVDGWLGGVQAGYNQQAGLWVLGIEGDIQATGEKDDPIICFTAGCPTGSAYGSNATKLPWFGTLRARLGVTSDPMAMWGPVMLYVTGGLAVGRIDETYNGGFIGGTTATVSADTTRAGWTVGGGAEGRIGQTNWTLKLEYLYIDFGHVSGGLNATGTPLKTPILINSDINEFLTTTVAFSGIASTHVTDNVFRIGLNYKWPPK